MAQGPGTAGWTSYDGGHLEQRVDYVDMDNHNGAPGIEAAKRDIGFDRIYTAVRGSAPSSPYRQERLPPIVLPSISQLSDMAPLSGFSFTSYAPGYPMVTQDRAGNAAMMHSAPGTFADFAGRSHAEDQTQIRTVYQVNREKFHDMQDDSLRLPDLNLNFTSRGPVLKDRVIPVPEQSVIASQMSQPSHSRNMEAYHPDALLQSSDPCSPSPTGVGAPPQRPVIMRHNIHTHQCDRCPSRFTRAGELKRHYKMHLPERRMFHCWIAGCDRNGERGFYRSDKFRDHQRKAHRCGKMLGNRGVEGGRE